MGVFVCTRETLNTIAESITLIRRTVVRQSAQRPSVSSRSSTKQFECFVRQAYLIISQRAWLNGRRKRDKLSLLLIAYVHYAEAPSIRRYAWTAVGLALEKRHVAPVDQCNDNGCGSYTVHPAFGVSPADLRTKNVVMDRLLGPAAQPAPSRRTPKRFARMELRDERYER